MNTLKYSLVIYKNVMHPPPPPHPSRIPEGGFGCFSRLGFHYANLRRHEMVARFNNETIHARRTPYGHIGRRPIPLARDGTERRGRSRLIEKRGRN